MIAERIVLAGGGSAGHVNPLLATAAELRRRGHEITVLGTEEGLEAELVPAQGFELVTIPKVPFPRRPSRDHLTLLRRFRAATDKARDSLEGARALVGFGGYVSTPAYRAARQLRIPYVIHEQNVRPGWANRLGSRGAEAVALTFPATKLRCSRGLSSVTGLPLRESISGLDRADREARTAARESFGLDPNLRTLLVTGGSLGAQHLNEALTAAVDQLPPDAQVLHLTGTGKDQPVVDALAGAPNAERWRVVDYVPDMERALLAADLVVCRSGAGTVAELTSLGIPALYVPLPIGNGEQRLNAEDVVEAGGAYLVPDADFNTDTVLSLVYPTLLDPAKLKTMSEAALRSSVGDGTAALADLVERVSK